MDEACGVGVEWPAASSHIGAAPVPTLSLRLKYSSTYVFVALYLSANPLRGSSGGQLTVFGRAAVGHCFPFQAFVTIFSHRNSWAWACGDSEKARRAAGMSRAITTSAAVVVFAAFILAL